MLRDVVTISRNVTQLGIEVSVQDMKFLSKRAVNWELIFQTAKERGLTPDDAQNQQHRRRQQQAAVNGQLG